MFAVSLLYSSALHTSLARVQDLPLTITTHKSTAVKVNGMTEDIFIIISGPGEVRIWYSNQILSTKPYPCAAGKFKRQHQASFFGILLKIIPTVYERLHNHGV